MKIGIIGGSGLYDLECLNPGRILPADTPFGKPSAHVVAARVGEHEVFFIPRHGDGHRLNPTKINYRANVYALKMMGCTKLLSISAVGSLNPNVKPGSMAIPDQFIDKTTKRVSTFFEGIAAHVHFAEPTCGTLRRDLELSCISDDDKTWAHSGGTYVCMEGPQFSTRAESLTNQNCTHNAHYIGMTAMPEAKLAREAEMCYANLALVTDNDAWSDEHVTVEQVVSTMKANAHHANNSITRLLTSNLTETVNCRCNRAMKGAVMTDLTKVPDAYVERFGLLLASQ